MRVKKTRAERKLEKMLKEINEELDSKRRLRNGIQEDIDKLNLLKKFIKRELDSFNPSQRKVMPNATV